MEWRDRVDDHKTETVMGIALVILFVALIATCALSERREEDLLERLCARGDQSACVELALDAEADAEAGRERGR